MRDHRRRNLLGRRRDRRLGFGQQLSLSQPGIPNNQLTAKDSAFFHRNRFRGHVSVEHGIAMNDDSRFRDNLPSHLTADFDALDTNSPKKLDH